MDAIKESLLRFLKDDTLRVAVVKGAWGTGKTYFWRNFFNEVRSELNFRAYSYVSLFGAGHISDLQRQVFSNFEMLDQEKLSKHLQKLKPLSTLLKSVDIPHLNTASAITDLVESKLIQNFLICFDDLERKESSVSGSSLLGMISQLSEDKGCKVVLIYNDEQLDTKTSAQIDEYREKVVDLELTYRPTIEDNLTIIWPDERPPGVEDLFKTLGLNNIRIMQRVKWALDYFEEPMSQKYPLLHPSFSYKVAVLTVIHHAYGTKISLQEVLSKSYSSVLFSKDEEEKERFRFLEEIRFLPEDQDRVIADYLIDGYVDFDHHKALLEKKNEQRRLGDINQKHREIWGKYHSNFQSSQDEFVDAQITFLKENVTDLGVRDVASAVKFIQELDDSKDLSAILDQAIDLFVSKVDRLDRHDFDFLDMDSAVVAQIQSRLAEKTPDYSITELFEALAHRDGWNPSDFPYLRRFSEDDFYAWVESSESDNVIALLRRFLERFGGADGEDAEVISRLKGALERIKGRSNLDAARVNFGILKQHRD
jgi:hypothetical protein